MKLLLNGARGKMGSALLQELRARETVKGEENFENDEVIVEGTRTGWTNKSRMNEVEVGIDFSNPEGTEGLLKVAQVYRFPLVIGTTGLSEDQQRLLVEAAKKIKIIYANNFSIGINILYALVEQATHLLNKDFQVEITEKHHKHKKDAPSGTAIALAKIIQKNRKIMNLAYGRHGHSDGRKNEEIGIHSLRCGTVFGEHQVIFSGDEEELRLDHQAFSRSIFAKGALLAAHWVVEQPQKTGLFSMCDVLNLKVN